MSKRLFRVYVNKNEVLMDKRSLLVENLYQALQDDLVSVMRRIFDSSLESLKKLKETNPAAYAAAFAQYPDLLDTNPPSDEELADLAKNASYEDENFGWKYVVNDEGLCVTGFLEIEDKTTDTPIVLSSWAELGKNNGFKVSVQVIN